MNYSLKNLDIPKVKREWEVGVLVQDNLLSENTSTRSLETHHMDKEMKKSVLTHICLKKVYAAVIWPSHERNAYSI